MGRNGRKPKHDAKIINWLRMSTLKQELVGNENQLKPNMKKTKTDK